MTTSEALEQAQLRVDSYQQLISIVSYCDGEDILQCAKNCAETAIETEMKTLKTHNGVSIGNFFVLSNLEKIKEQIQHTL